MRRGPDLDPQRRPNPIKPSARTAKPANLITEDDSGQVSASDLLQLVLWLGIVTAVVEVALLAVIKYFSLASAPAGWADPGDRLRHGYLWLSPHVVWMAPVTAVATLSVPALVLAGLNRLKRGVVSVRLAAGLLSFFCFMSLLYLYPRLYDIAVLLLAGGLAMQCARLVGANTARWLRAVRRSTKWLVSLVLAAAVGMNALGMLRERLWLADLPELPTDAPNVLLLLLDTVRAANLSVYGYVKQTTPHLEELAAGGVVFDRALSTSPWTLPGHVSLFTGRLPYEFNVNFLSPYEGEHRTLAEELSARGYETAGFVGNLVYCAYESGITRGFVHYEDYRIKPSEFLVSMAWGRRVAQSRTVHDLLSRYGVFGFKDAAAVTDDFLRWLDRRSGDRPFFAFVNYMDAHEPYLPPPEYEEKFGAREYRNFDEHRYFLRWVARRGRETMSAAELGAEVGAYDGTIAFEDAQIGTILAELRNKGSLQNTLIVVTSDHGEQFGEHGLHVHGNSLFMPLLHVPLIFAFGDRLPAGRRMGVPVSIKDIPATIMRLTGLSGGGPFPGESLDQYWAASGEGPQLVAEPILSELTDIRGAPTMKSLVFGRYHYIWSEAGFEALFDVDSDPNELNSLMTNENMELITNMRRALVPHIRNDRALWQRLPERAGGGDP